MRAVDGRGLGQGGKERRLWEAQVRGVGPEVNLRRRPGAIRPLPVVGRVQIQLQDMPLAELLVHSPGKRHGS